MPAICFSTLELGGCIALEMGYNRLRIGADSASTAIQELAYKITSVCSQAATGTVWFGYVSTASAR